MCITNFLPIFCYEENQFSDIDQMVKDGLLDEIEAARIKDRREEDQKIIQAWKK